MLVCPKCGLESSPGKKFCRRCGTALPQQSSVGEAPAGKACPVCGSIRSAGAKFCRSCGASLTPEERVASTPPAERASPELVPASESQSPAAESRQDGIPGEPVRALVEPLAPKEGGETPGQTSSGEPGQRQVQSTRRSWTAAAAVVIALLLAGVAGYWYSRPTQVSAPGEEVLRDSIGLHIPPFGRVESIRILSSGPVSNAAEPTFNTRMRVSITLLSDTFVESATEDGVVFLTPHISRGGSREAEGLAVSRRSGDAWETTFTWDADPVPSLGRPRESFSSRRTIVRGSAEETAFREEQRRQQEEQDRLAQVRRDEEVARQRELEEARQLAERRKLEAETAERARVEAARREQIARTALEEQRRREEAERRAREDAERSAEADAVAKVRSIPVGTELNVRLLTTLNSGKTRVEERFETTVAEDVVIGGRTVVPAGSMMRGIVSSVQAAGRLKRTARMTLAFDLLRIDDRSYPIRGQMVKAVSGPGIKGDAAKIGAGAAVGAIIGGILGGGKGALTGILVGGGGTVAATEGKEVELAKGSILRVRIDSIQGR